MFSSRISTGQWQTIFAVVAAVDAYLLIQTELALDPIAKVVLGAIAVGLAVLRPGGDPAPHAE